MFAFIMYKEEHQHFRNENNLHSKTMKDKIDRVSAFNSFDISLLQIYKRHFIYFIYK